MKLFIKSIFILIVILSLGILAYLGFSFFRLFGDPTASDDLSVNINQVDGFQFIVMGDNEGDTAVFQELVDQASDIPAALFMHLGDLTPNAQEADFANVQARLKTLPYPYYTAVGNNDIYKDPDKLKYQKYFSQSQLGLGMGENAYYSFDYKNAHFIVLDNSDRRVGFGDEQLNWLESDLSNNDSQWTFLIAHRPIDVPFSDVFGDDETPASRESNERFTSIIKKYPITRMYVGHIHTLFSYSIGEIPVTISGGGGAAPQEALEDFLGPQFHFLEVTVTDSQVTQTVHRLE
ncbi:MAG: metallophosphoesterase [bacterium]